MSLIKKGILIEGENGETIVREYYVDEKPESPYGREWRKKMADRNDKVRRLMSRKGAPEPKPYTWSMGYNHCSGRYSSGTRYCPFQGSSLNRNKDLRYGDCKKTLQTDLTLIPFGDPDAITLAHKMARAYLQRGIDIPPQLFAYTVRPDSETERRFREWFSTKDALPEDGYFLPIYKLSARSRGKIKDKATAFFRACPGERVFCTLTFITSVDDQTGVTLLNKFLTSLRKEFKNLQYLWVAERQTKNVKYPNNIHFHVILNKRLPVRRWNALWLMQQYNAGLRGETLWGVPISMAEIEDRYKRGTVHKVFNPLDIKKVRSIAGLSAYLTKYITKQKDCLFGCSPWHCSRGVSRLFTRATVGPSAFRYMMSLENCKLDRSTGEVFMPQVVRPKGGAAFCMVVYVNKKDAPLRYLREMEFINKALIRGEINPVRGILDTVTSEGYRQRFCQPNWN